LFRRLKQLTPNSTIANIGINIPALQVSHWNRRSPINVVVTDRQLRKSTQTAVLAHRNQHYAKILGCGELLDFELVSLLAAIRPQRVTHANPFTQILGSGRPYFHLQI